MRTARVKVPIPQGKRARSAVVLAAAAESFRRLAEDAEPLSDVRFVGYESADMPVGVYEMDFV